ncbi:hypothetical protein MHYP_G00088750 [Metynnis hypsauchen]
MYLTLKNPKASDAGLYVLGIYTSGKDPLGHIQIKIIRRVDKKSASKSVTNAAEVRNSSAVYASSTLLSMSEKLSIEMGYTGRNEWFEWMMYTAKSTRVSNCIACSASRPQLGTAPFRLTQAKAAEGLECALQVFMQDKFSNQTCQLLSYLLPATKPNMPPGVLALPGNYTCFSRSSGQKNVTTLPWCAYTTDITTDTGGYQSEWFTTQNIARADLWWLCGDKKLRAVLPQSWQGSCALVQLLMPFHIYPTTAFSTLPERLPHYHRQKRDASAPGAFDNSIYTDAIGVPRGVPDEFKARNQIAAGFESIFLWPTINKNVDWIDYLYYNQLRFINHSRDAFKAVHEQLQATSLMAWQNRIALDMLLAERGGVCKMFGDFCLAAALITTCGCCLIPCARGLILRLIDSAITKVMLYETIAPEDPGYATMLPLERCSGVEQEREVEEPNL